jgi:hypothetical protein
MKANHGAQLPVGYEAGRQNGNDSPTNARDDRLPVIDKPLHFTGAASGLPHHLRKSILTLSRGH